jgi:hypothetical protein
VNPRIEVRAVSIDGQRFVEVDGHGFSRGGSVTDIIDAGAPQTDTFGQDTVSADGDGNFIDRIAVTLSEITGANVKAQDLSSHVSTTGSL